MDAQQLPPLSFDVGDLVLLRGLVLSKNKI